MSKNKDLSQTISYKGTFDVSGIIRGLQEVRNQMGKMTTDVSAFKKVDEQLEKIQNLTKTMQTAVAKGFSNPKELEDFNKMTEKLKKSLEEITAEFTKLDTNFLNKSVENLKTDLNKITSDFKKVQDALSGSLKEVGLKNFTQQFINGAKEAKSFEKIQEEINKELEKQINTQKQLIEDSKTRVQNAATNKEKVEKTVPLSGLGVKNFRPIGEPGKKITPEQRTDAIELFNKGVMGIKENFNPRKKNLDTLINTTIENFREELRLLGLEMVNEDTIAKTLSTTYNKMSDNIRTAQITTQNAQKISEKTEKEADSKIQTLENAKDYLSSKDIRDDYQQLTDNYKRLGEVQQKYNQASMKDSPNLKNLKQINSLLEQQFGQIKQNTQATRENIKTQIQYDNTFDNMKDAVKTFLSISSAVNGLKNVIRSTFEDIKNLDKSFAEIAMVTDYSVGQMWQSYNQYSEMANKLGQSTQGVIQASGLFYQQGLDTAESLDLTEDTMKLATLAGTDFSEATSQMTAALRGFKMEMDEGNRVTDVYSELAAKAAADVQGIAYAMSKTASIAESAGMEFETTSAFLTQMIETTQEAPENIGTAMKTIIARFTELKENVAGTDKSAFDDLDYNKVDVALKSVGVSLKDASGQFRDLDDVFLELSGKWDTLDRNTQRYIATIAAGSRQQSRFIAMMDNYDRTMELVNTAYNSAGKSSEQFAKYQDTLEYKLNQLKNTWEQFRVQFFNSDFFKGIIENLNNLLNKLTSLDGKQITTLIATVLILGKTIAQNLVGNAQKGFRRISEIAGTTFDKIKNKFSEQIPLNPSDVQVNARLEAIKQKINQIELEKINIESDNSDVINDLNAIQRQLDFLKADASSINFDGDFVTVDGTPLKNKDGVNIDSNSDTAEYLKLDKKQKGLANEEKSLEKTKKSTQQNAEMIGNLFATTLLTTITTVMTEQDPGAAFGTIFISGLTAIMPQLLTWGTTFVKTFATTGGTAGAKFNAAFQAAGGPVIWIITGIIAAIAGVTAGVMAINKAAKEKTLEHRLENAKKKAEDLEKKLIDCKKEFSDISESKKELEDIEENFDKIANKTVKTTEEQEEYNKMVESISEKYPSIISYYDEETNKMIVNNELLEQKLALMEKEEKIAKKNLLMVQNASVAANASVEGLKLSSEMNSNLGFVEDDLSLINVEDMKAFLSGESKIVNRLSETNQTIAGATIGIAAGTRMGFANPALAIPTAILSGYASSFLGDKQIGDKTIDTASIASMIGIEEDIDVELGQQIYDAIVTNLNDETGELSEEVSKQISDAAKAVGLATDMTAQDAEAKLLEIADTISTYNLKYSEHIKQVEAELSGMWSEYFSQNEDITEMGAAFGGQFMGSLAEQYQTALQGFSIETGWEGSIDDAIESLQEYSDALSLSLSDEDKKQLKDAINSVQSGWNVQDDWKDLSDEARKVLTKIGVDTADKYKEYTDNGALDDEEFVQKLLIDYTQVLNEELGGKFEEIILAYQDEVSELGLAEDLNYNEYKNRREQLINNIENSGREKGLSDEQIAESVEAIKTAINDVAIEEALKIIDGITGYQNFNVNTLKALSDRLSNFDEETQRAAKAVINSFNLTADEMNVLASMNWDTDIRDMMAHSQEYIESLKDAGNDTEEATNKFKNIAQDLAYAVGNIVTSSLTYKQMLSDSMAKFGESGYGIEEYFTGLSEFQESGSISAETFAKNYELFKDVAEFKQTKDGTTIEFTDELTDIFVQSFSSEAENFKMQAENTGKLLADGYSSNVEAMLDESIYEKYTKGTPEDQEKMLENLNADERKIIQDTFAQGKYTLGDSKAILREATLAGYEAEQQRILLDQVATENLLNDSKEKEKELNEELGELDKQKIEDQKAIIEAQKEFDEALHGTQFWEASSDGLYNYTQQLDKLKEKIEDLQKDLNKVDSLDNGKQVVEELLDSIEQASLLRAAESSVIDTYLDNNLKTLQQYSDKYGQFYSQNEDGSLNINFEKLESIKANDAIRENLENLITTRNEYLQKQEELSKEEEEQRQNFLDMQKEALDKYVSVQENIANVLEQQAKEEVDTLKEKYDAMKEADNDYLDALSDAIEKQRALRDLENKYDDLAEQRKKLSLMQRDTSGANRKEQKELEKSIKESEQDLLDTEIDNMIDAMKELQESQQEERDALIENKNAVIENTNYLKEASIIQSGFSTQEDYIAWMLENNPEAQDWSPEKTEAMIGTWEEEYGAMAAYVELHNQSIDEAMTHTEQEILNKAQTISNGIETQSTDLMTKVETEVNSEIADAADKLSDANAKLAETNLKIEDANTKLTETKNQTTLLQDAFSKFSATAIARLAELEKIIGEYEEKSAEEKQQEVTNALTEAAKYNSNAAKAYNSRVENEKTKQNNSVKNYPVVSNTQYGNVATNYKKEKNTFSELSGAINSYLGNYTNKRSISENDNTYLYRVKYYHPVLEKIQYTYFKNKDDIDNSLNFIKREIGEEAYKSLSVEKQKFSFDGEKEFWKKYATGGLVNYTGPAWVDGTPSKPEAFLSAQDTERIGNAAKLLADLPILNSTSNANNAVSSNIGDTSIEIHINVESLASDYDVDQMIERVKNDILDVSKPTGTSVILHK